MKCISAKKKPNPNKQKKQENNIIIIFYLWSLTEGNPGGCGDTLIHVFGEEI